MCKGQVRVWAITAGQKVHTKDGLPSGPKPVAFGQFGVGEKGTSHDDSGLPMTFNGAVLGLSMGG